MWKLKLCVTSQREILGGLLYFLKINEKFYKNCFLPQILAMIIICFPPISMKGIASKTFVKLLFIERYKRQTSYRACIKYVLEKSAFSTLLISYFISCEVGRHTQPCSIHLNSQPYHSNARWFRRYPAWPVFFKKIHWPLRSNDRQQRKTSVHLKLTELYFKSISQSSLWCKENTLYLPSLVSWLGTGAEICLFHGRVVEKTRLREAFWWAILFQLSSICLNLLQILKAKARSFVWHWTKSISAWSYSNSTVMINFSRSTSR